METLFTTMVLTEDTFLIRGDHFTPQRYTVWSGWACTWTMMAGKHPISFQMNWSVSWLGWVFTLSIPTTCVSVNLAKVRVDSKSVDELTMSFIVRWRSWSSSRCMQCECEPLHWRIERKSYIMGNGKRVAFRLIESVAAQSVLLNPSCIINTLYWNDSENTSDTDEMWLFCHLL